MSSVSFYNIGSFNFAAMVDALMSAVEAEAEAAENNSAPAATALASRRQANQGKTNIHAIMAAAGDETIALDPMSMSVDDLIFWLLISVQTAFNKHIMKQAQKVQDKQSAVENASGEDEIQRAQSSLDQETQAMQRLLQKRQQFVDMFLQMLKKLDESIAKVWQISAA